nr:hypothetical protein [Sodalis-like endosymbiont of Proechinophthirus fluctus]
MKSLYAAISLVDLINLIIGACYINWCIDTMISSMEKTIPTLR